MTTTLTLPPSGQVTGDFQLEPPLPLDLTAYVQPDVLGTDTYAYTGGDGLAAADIPAALHLPDVGAAPSNPTVKAVSSLTWTGDGDTSSTSFTIDYPTLDVDGAAFSPAVGQVVMVFTAQSESSAPATPAISGFTQAFAYADANTWRQKVTCLWRAATGSEGASETITIGGGGSRINAVLLVLEGVSTTDPFGGVTPTFDHDGGAVNPDPPSVSSVPVNGRVLTVLASNIFPNGADAFDTASDGPAGYGLVFSDHPEPRHFIVYSKLVPSGGTENPGAYAFTFDNFGVVTVALNPASNQGLTAVVVTAAADGTATGNIGGTDPPVLAAVNEVQRLVSTLTTGTFTLTFDGQTTASINWNDTAATIETRLEALSNIGVGDVTVTGGPLNSNPVSIEFTGALAATNVALISSSSGSVVVSVEQTGYAAESFIYRGAWNIPEAGGSTFCPQGHVFTLSPAVYAAGRPIDITVADHDNLQTAMAALAVVEGLAASPVGGLGTPVADAAGSSVVLGDRTPATAGAVLLGIVAKASSSFYSGSAPAPNTPARLVPVARAEADSGTLSLFLSGPTAAGSAYSAGQSSWSGVEDFSSVVVELTPAASAGSVTFAQALDSADPDRVLEIGAAAGTLYEVFEFDLSSIPADAAKVEARLRVSHVADALNPLRFALAGISADGLTVVESERTQLHYPEQAGVEATVETRWWTKLADGSDIDDWPRLGLVVISNTRAPGLSSHQITGADLVLAFETGGPVVSSVTPPASPGDPISWVYASDGGYAQANYEIVIVAGSSQDPDSATTPANPLNPATGEIVYASGLLRGSSVRSLSLENYPLARGGHTLAVRAYARLATGLLVASDWRTANFDVTGSPPSAGSHSTPPAFDPDTGGVDVVAVAPAGVSRAWLARSTDGGTSWALAGPFTVSPSSTQTIVDYEAPVAAPAVRYEIAYDAGPMTETSPPVAVGSGDVATTIAFPNQTLRGWYLHFPTDAGLNTPVEVAGFSGPDWPREVIVAESGSGPAVVASSAHLAARFGLELRIRDGAERAAVDAALAARATCRLVSSLGDEWWVASLGVTSQLQRWKPLDSEVTGLRDGWIKSVDMVEVRYRRPAY